VPEYEVEVEVTFVFAASEHSGALVREGRLRRFLEAYVAQAEPFEGVEVEVAPRGKWGYPRIVEEGYRPYSLPKPPKSDPPVELDRCDPHPYPTVGPLLSTSAESKPFPDCRPYCRFPAGLRIHVGC
jgi:hypothetical protein